LIRALKLDEDALGVNHPNVAWSLSGLAEVCVEQGRLDEARAHFTRALELREKALGPDHPMARETRERLKAVE
jgi:serine/threonine-protein kinase